MGQCVSCQSCKSKSYKTLKPKSKKLQSSFCSTRFSINGSFIDDNYYCDMKNIFLMPAPGNPDASTREIVHRDAVDTLLSYFCDCNNQKKHVPSCSTFKLGINLTTKSTLNLHNLTTKSTMNLHNLTSKSTMNLNSSTLNKRPHRLSMMSLNELASRLELDNTGLSQESLILSVYDLDNSFSEDEDQRSLWYICVFILNLFLFWNCSNFLVRQMKLGISNKIVFTRSYKICTAWTCTFRQKYSSWSL